LVFWYFGGIIKAVSRQTSVTTILATIYIHSGGCIHAVYIRISNDSCTLV
jgi:hypothetical protein